MAEEFVIALVTGIEQRARIRDALRGRANLEFVSRIDEVIPLASSVEGELKAVIVEPCDCDDVDTTSLIRALRLRCPKVPIVAYFRVSPASSSQIRDAVLAGAHELLFHGVDDSGIALRAVIQAAELASVAATVSTAFEAILPAALHTMIRFVAANIGKATQVATVARALGVHRRTLVNQCLRCGMPSPQVVITLCRIGVVAEMLTRTPRSIDQVALDLEFPSGTALRNMIKRYTHVTATELRSVGLPMVLRVVRDQVQRDPPGVVEQPVGISAT